MDQAPSCLLFRRLGVRLDLGPGAGPQTLDLGGRRLDLRLLFRGTIVFYSECNKPRVWSIDAKPTIRD